MGFEPMNTGFANPPLSPLGYVAEAQLKPALKSLASSLSRCKPPEPEIRGPRPAYALYTFFLGPLTPAVAFRESTTTFEHFTIMS